MKDKLLIVTGSSGRIGKAFIADFLRKNPQEYSIVGLDLFAPVESIENFEFIKTYLSAERPTDPKMNAADALDLHGALAQIKKKHGNHITSFIHLAAYYSFLDGDWPQYEDITVNGTKRILESLSKDFKCDQLIFTSTMLVHKPTEPGHPINENTPLPAAEDAWLYPRSKILTEKIIHDLGKDISQITILRICGLYDDDCNSIPLSNQIQRIFEQLMPDALLFPGNSKHGAPFMHMKDMVAVLAATVEKRAKLLREITFLVAEPETLSYDTLQREFGKLINGKEMRTIRIPSIIAIVGSWLQNALPLMPKWDSHGFFIDKRKPFIQPWMIPHADDHYELDLSLAKKHLDWTPKHSLRHEMAKMIEKLKAHPVKWYKMNKLLSPKWLASTEKKNKK